MKTNKEIIKKVNKLLESLSYETERREAMDYLEHALEAKDKQMIDIVNSVPIEEIKQYIGADDISNAFVLEDWKKQTLNKLNQ